MSQSGWYYVSNGQRLGPLAFEQLRHLTSTGQLRPDALVWIEGMADWQPASTIPGLFPAPPAYAPPPPPQTYDPLETIAAAAHDPYARSAYDPGRSTPRPTRPSPTAAPAGASAPATTAWPSPASSSP